MTTGLADPDFDQIAFWPEVKLDILRDYASAFSEVLSQRPGLHHVYVEGFAGSGVRLSEPRGELVPGNPLNALAVRPPFKEFFFVDLEGDKAEQLGRLVRDRKDVRVHVGDCSRVLVEDVFPRVRLEDYRRGLCVLDPFGLNLAWGVFASAGKMQSVEIFFSFPVRTIQRTVLSLCKESPDCERVSSTVLGAIDRFWGDDSWRTVALPAEKKVRGDEPVRIASEAIVESFRKRLIEQAGFTFVPKPMPMRDPAGEAGEVVYYLFFTSHNVLGGKIVEDILDKHSHRAEKT